MSVDASCETRTFVARRLIDVRARIGALRLVVGPRRWNVAETEIRPPRPDDILPKPQTRQRFCPSGSRRGLVGHDTDDGLPEDLDDT